jgi:cbb3-type cytochrome oxidase subunit 3
MSDYESWRAFVAGWGSLYCAAIFIIGVAVAMAPSRKRFYEEAALIPLKDD